MDKILLFLVTLYLELGSLLAQSALDSDNIIITNVYPRDSYLCAIEIINQK